MMWLTENIQACLRDFLAATASMARKRHLASTTRGFCGFCLTPSIHKPIRSIRLIRGRKDNLPCGVLPSRQRLRGELSLSEGVAPGYSK